MEKLESKRNQRLIKKASLQARKRLMKRLDAEIKSLLADTEFMHNLDQELERNRKSIDKWIEKTYCNYENVCVRNKKEIK